LKLTQYAEWSHITTKEPRPYPLVRGGCLAATAVTASLYLWYTLLWGRHPWAHATCLPGCLPHCRFFFDSEHFSPVTTWKFRASIVTIQYKL